MRITIIFVFCFISGILSAQVVLDERIVDWSKAGYSGQYNEPDLWVDATDFGALGDSLQDNSQALQDAISFANGQHAVIYFPSGIYLFNSGISLPDSIIIRGASSDETHFVFDLGGDAQNCFSISRSQSSDFVGLINGFEKGAAKIVVEDASSFSSGQHAELREMNGDWDTEPISWADYSVGQILKIEDVVADTLFVSSPLRIDYDPSLNPEIRPIITRHEAGLECFKITRADNTVQGVGYNFYFGFASNCWLKGIESTKSVGSHVYITRSTNLEVSGSYIHHAFAYDGSGTRGYGVTLNMHAGECLIENNIFRHLRHAMMAKTGANGNVFAYNYSFDPYRSEPIHDFSGDISLHGHYAFSNLFEGNIIQNIIIDHYWGPAGPWNTYFRNRAELYGFFMTSSDTAETSFQNIVGNEISNLQPVYGLYVLTGSEHFQYGNNVKGTIIPSGTDELDDISYYLENIPAFWDITDPWPSIGLPYELNEYSIPAKKRYLNGWTKTVCADTLYTAKNNVTAISGLKIYPNPTEGNVCFDKSVDIQKIQLIDLNGRILKTYKKAEHNIFIPAEIHNGVYFIRIESKDLTEHRKIVLTR